MASAILFVVCIFKQEIRLCKNRQELPLGLPFSIKCREQKRQGCLDIHQVRMSDSPLSNMLMCVPVFLAQLLIDRARGKV